MSDVVFVDDLEFRSVGMKVDGGLDYYLVYSYIYVGSIISAEGGCRSVSLREEDQI